MPESDAFLLDTHAFLWLATDDERLSHAARELVLDPSTELFLSVGSVWEIAIKKSLGRMELTIPLSRLVEEQLKHLRTNLLEIRCEHALLVETLPFHHRDPFDRLLIAQAIQENLPLLSADKQLDAYPVNRVW